MPPRTWAIVVAAGSGARFGGPKQFQRLGGRTVLERSIEAARSVAERVVAVVPPEAGTAPGADLSVPGGATRSDSVRAGLAAVPAGVPVVVVHDAARPLASPELFRAVVAAVAAGADGAVPGVAVPDTVKRVGPDGVVSETLDRSGLVLVQTPQAFSTPALRRAHRAGGQATDDAALVEAAGGRVVVVPGEPGNLKITVADDLARAEAMIGPG
ncbi:MAG TPA: 2-C-methyl-D-erythritol 4-phosphate cytidylyltransferase [Acidimicrobiales bacterium]|nr:2-C-methyl-D-erythritol 4-phosphate cytidylyltransferase [Acidimicrobiales bacterium]